MSDNNPSFYFSDEIKYYASTLGNKFSIQLSAKKT